MKIVFLRYPRSTNTPFDALRFVELMGIDMSRVEIIDKPTKFDRVIVPDEAIYPMDAYRAEYVKTFDAIRDNIKPMEDKKIYLSRSHFHYRTSLNETYYEDFFSRRGFTIIYPETLSIEEQIAYIAGADEVVTTMGSMAHLLLFAKSTTKATILNRSTQCLPAQVIVGQARGIESYYVDAFLNPLPVPHVNGPFLFGPNRFFRDYLEERDIAFEDQELQVDFSSMNGMGITFMEEWNKMYMGEAQSKLSVFKEKDVRYYADDYAAYVGQMVLGCEIGAERILEHPDIERLKTENKKLSEKRKKLEADLKKSRAEVQKLRNSKSWKVTAPLRAVMRLFEKD